MEPLLYSQPAKIMDSMDGTVKKKKDLEEIFWIPHDHKPLFCYSLKHTHVLLDFHKNMRKRWRWFNKKQKSEVLLSYNFPDIQPTWIAYKN